MLMDDHMRTMVRTGYWFNSLHCFNYSIAIVAPEPAKPLKLVVSKKKGAYKRMVPVHTCLRITNLFTFDFEKYRKSYFWMIKKCTSTKPIKKLTNHLTTVHEILDGTRRREFAARAREVEVVQPGVRKVSITITAAFQKRMLEKRSSFVFLLNVVVRKWSTKHYQCFDINKDPLLLSFVENLQSFDGGKRSQWEAWEMASDVSKFLAPACDIAKWQSPLR